MSNIDSTDTHRNVLSFDCNECENVEKDNDLPNIYAFIQEIGINIYDDCIDGISVRRNILSVHIDEMLFKFEEKIRRMKLSIINLQIDNKLFAFGNYDFPVILCAAREYTGTLNILSPMAIEEYFQRLENKALLQFDIQYYKDKFDIQSMNCKLDSIRAYIEDTYVNEILDYLINYEFSNIIDPNLSFLGHELQRGYVFVSEKSFDQAVSLSTILQLKYVRIEPISILLSVHTCVRLYLALDHSPLQFSAYEKRNIYTLPTRFGQTLGMHYLSGAIFGAGWVVGSLEILGSPSGLARSVSTGIRDFVSLPFQGLFRGPWGFLIGFSQGSASLLRNITAGTVNSVTKLAASVARNLDLLTLDGEHFQRTEALRRSRPQGVAEGFTQGLTGFGISLLGALGGLARHPLEARSSVEVVTGVVKGILGAFAKPISGAAELLALTGQGVLHSVGFNSMPMQRYEFMAIPDLKGCSADCKLFWKIMPKNSREELDLPLFKHHAVMTSDGELKHVTIILTLSMLIILDLNEDHIIEMFPVEKTEMYISGNNKSLIEIGVLRMDTLTEPDSRFFRDRMMTFLEKSKNNLPNFSNHKQEEKKVPEKYDLTRFLTVDENIAAYILNYFTLVKYNADFLKFCMYVEN